MSTEALLERILAGGDAASIGLPAAANLVTVGHDCEPEAEANTWFDDDTAADLLRGEAKRRANDFPDILWFGCIWTTVLSALALVAVLTL